jgi:hypothetical protein
MKSPFAKYYHGDEIGEDDMAGLNTRNCTKFYPDNVRGRNRLGDLRL